MMLGCEVGFGVLRLKPHKTQDVRTQALVCLLFWHSDAPLA